MTTLPDPPPGLPERQQPIWHDLATRILQAHPHARIDPASLHAAAAAQDEWNQLDQVCQNSLPVIQRGTQVIPNPAYVQRRAAAAIIIRYARQFGLDQPGPPAAMDNPPDLGGHGQQRLPCPKCGELHNPGRCDGHRREDGTQCRLGRGARTDHTGYGYCAHHTGNTPSGRAAAEKERASRAFFKLAAHGQVKPLEDPLAAIADMAGESVAWRTALMDALNQLGPLTVLDEHGIERLRALAPFAQQMSKEAFASARAMAELDIDERMIARAAQASDLLAERVTAGFDRVIALLRELVVPRLAEGQEWPELPVIEGIVDEGLRELTSS